MDASSSETAVLVRPPPRRSSSDALQVLSAAEGSPKRRPRPKLTLASSTSTPQLRELAELANTPASPILSHQPSLASLATSFASGAPSTVNLLPPFSLEAPSSRWSMDSTDHHAIIRPVITSPIAESPQASPAKTKTRDRLMSFISRARAGSVDKQSTSPTRGDHSPRSPRDYDFGLPPQSGLSSTMSSRRTSRSTYAPQPISTATSTTSSQSDTSIVTPGDSQQDVTSPDPFRSASTSFTPVSFMPDLTDTPDTPAANELDFFPLEPTLPPPSPDVPTPSLFLPAKPESLLSSLARKAIRRRKKKLVISVMPSPYDDDSDGEAGRMRRAREQKQRDDHILRWCDNLGTVRHFECLDGDFHVYWRDSEVAEMVSRVGSQVIIRGVGRVSLSWRYVN
ncbi:hypothetical protein BDW22DRAFT_862553 [Trametopsis cervina]|nr:hypothetical protein BDW22DRAFT_862553 [Trametopsis cervina]